MGDIMKIFLKRIIFCVVIFLDIFIIAAIASFITSFFKIDVSKYTITSDKLPKEFEGFKILHLSDLHNKHLGKDNSKLIAKIEEETPDIIVISGDMVSSNSKNFNSFLSLAENLSKKYPVYYVFGNHEQRLSNSKQLTLLTNLKALGINILDNTCFTISKKDSSITLYGLKQSLNHYKNYLKGNDASDFSVAELNKTFPNYDKSDFNILLSHNPLYFNAYADWGADLVFSGHIHGGLIRIPFIGGIISPERTLFPKYSGGEYKINTSTMIVSRGLGFSTLNLRIFNNPEICVVELKHKK